MKTITVYNEKGGCGKTTATIFLASWLASRGHRVLVLDFDKPTYHVASIREKESATLRMEKSPLVSFLRLEGLMSDPASFRPPFQIRPMDADDCLKGDPEGLFAILDSIPEDDYDYLICDFPGRYSDDEAISFMCGGGYIDALLIPVECDSQTVKSAMVIADAARRAHIRSAIFWNRTTQDEVQYRRIDRMNAVFRAKGVPILPHGIRQIKKFSRDSNERLFVRSTMCFPERYVHIWCPTLMDFLESAKEFIDK